MYIDDIMLLTKKYQSQKLLVSYLIIQIIFSTDADDADEEKDGKYCEALTL